MTDISPLTPNTTSRDGARPAVVVNGSEAEPFARLRRTVHRVRGSLERGQDAEPEDGSDLRLELMLLREENVRLKMAQHRPPELGATIDHLRLLAAGQGEAEVDDELWAVLTDMLVIRESLEQACLEIEAAVAAVRRRLQRLSPELDAIDLSASDRAEMVAGS